MKQSHLRRAVNWIAIGLAATVAAAIPLIHGIDTYNEQVGKLELKAAFITQDIARHIFLNEDIWQYQLARLSALAELPQNDRDVNRTRILDRLGDVVLEQGPQIDWPVMTRGVLIFVKGAMTGRVEIGRSLRPLLIESGFVAILGLLLGLTAYAAIRWLPMRALDRALDALETQGTRFEEALNNMLLGMCRFDASQRVLVSNRRYCEIYGLTEEEMRPGTTLQQILERRRVHEAGQRSGFFEY